MEKLPLIVFKTLGVSIILMFLLDTSLVVFDTININSRVTNIAGVMQNEIARHNSMPTELNKVFKAQLDTLVEKSSVAKSVTTNMNSLSQDTPLNYGDIAELTISVDMAPTRVYFGSNDGVQTKEKPLLGKEVLNYKLEYSYQVPCLKYLK